MIERITQEVRKWVAESDAVGMLQRSSPIPSKKKAQEWLNEKAVDARYGDSTVRLMSAAIVKGLIEHNDGTRYFGSTMSYTYHFANAVKYGLVTEGGEVSSIGVEWYERCLKDLPQTRQVFWTNGVGLPVDGIGEQAQKEAKKS